MRAASRASDLSGRYGEPDRRGEPDQRVFLSDVSWEDFERILEVRGDRAGPRVTYLEGELELMSPSIDHERIKTTLARMVEAYALDRGLALNGYGSWTVKRKRTRRGVEPDECYVLGTHEPDRPDLAIEVIWTHGGLDKLEVYRGLGVREVWIHRGGHIDVYRLRGDRYRIAPRSVLLPDLDLRALARLAEGLDQTQAVREFLAEARRGGPAATRRGRALARRR